MKRTFRMIAISICTLCIGKIERAESLGPGGTKIYWNKKFGYKIQVPECWKVEINPSYDDEGTPVEISGLVIAQATDACKKSNNFDLPNIEITGGLVYSENKNSPKKIALDHYNLEKYGYNGGKLQVDKFSRDEVEIVSIGYLDTVVNPPFIRWHLYFYCDRRKREIEFSDRQLTVEKIKNFENRQAKIDPEIQKVIDSFQCVEPEKPQKVNAKSKEEYKRKK